MTRPLLPPHGPHAPSWLMAFLLQGCSMVEEPMAAPDPHGAGAATRPALHPPVGATGASGRRPRRGLPGHPGAERAPGPLGGSHHPHPSRLHPGHGGTGGRRGLQHPPGPGSGQGGRLLPEPLGAEARIGSDAGHRLRPAGPGHPGSPRPWSGGPRLGERLPGGGEWVPSDRPHPSHPDQTRPPGRSPGAGPGAVRRRPRGSSI